MKVNKKQFKEFFDALLASAPKKCKPYLKMFKNNVGIDKQFDAWLNDDKKPSDFVEVDFQEMVDGLYQLYAIKLSIEFGGQTFTAKKRSA